MQSTFGTVEVSAQHKVLVTPADPRVANLFPHHKKLPDGRFVLPHNSDEVRILRNLGYSVPSPVMVGYNWGNTKPFHAQVVTTAMLVVEPRCYVLNTMGCVDADTEYLSPTGWKRISEYQGGSVAQYDPDTGAAEFVKPSRFVKEPCYEMIHIKTARGIDQMLSPEHRMLLTHRKTGKRETVSAEVFEGRYHGHISVKGKAGQIGRQDAHIPTVFSMSGTGLDYDDATIRLLVAMKADGHIKKDNPSTPVHIRLKKTRKKNRLRMLLAAARVEYTEVSKDYPTAVGYTLFKFMLPELSKTYGPRWWYATTAQKLVIADEVLHWDGCKRGTTDRFSSYDKATADYIQFVFSSIGTTTRVCSRERETGTEYTLNIRHGVVSAGVLGYSGKTVRDDNVTRCKSTDGYKYCFMVPSTFLVFRRNGKIFASSNTGKTRSVLFGYDFLRHRFACKKMLVAAPLSTLNFTWAKEVFQIFPNYRVVVVHGNKAKRQKLLAQDADIYVINHDGLGVVEAEIMAKFGPDDILCIDEVATFRNSRSKKHKVAKRISNKFGRVWGLTGTPTPREPTDAYGIIQIVNPGQAGVPKAFTHFREELMMKQGQFRWLPRQGAQEKVFKYMQPSVRFTLADCMDMPPVIHQEYEAEMSPQQNRVYKELLKHCRSMHEKGSITAANEGVVLNKLMQVSLGCVFGDDKAPKYLDCKGRVNTLRELIEDNDRSVIVFAPFVPVVDMLEAELKKDFAMVHKVHGAVSQKERSQIFNTFQNSVYKDAKQVIVAHPATMAHGLTLTAANLIVWYGPTWDLEIFEQANARIARPGQDADRVVIAKVAATPVERRVYKRLEGKQKMQNVLLDMFD